MLMAQVSQTPAAIAQRAWDELAIIKTISRLGNAQNNSDFAAYRACFTDMILIDQPGIPGWKPKRMSADEWTNTGLPVLASFDLTQHRLFNHIIDIHGDEATCTVDLDAIHLIKENGQTKMWEVVGRYTLRLQRAGDQWLVSERALKVRQELGDLTLKDKAFARAASAQVRK